MQQIIVNDRLLSVDFSLQRPVVDFLREKLHLKGTKIGCREGDCGACTVVIGEFKDNKIYYSAQASCLLPLANVIGKQIITIEGINLPELNTIQQAFLQENGAQCGFCTPGFLLSLVGFCLDNREKNMENAIDAVAGNICRCTGYKAIERSIMILVDKLQKMDKKNKINWLIENKFIPEYFSRTPQLFSQMIKEKFVKKTDGLLIAGGTDLMVQNLLEVEDATQIQTINECDELKGVRREGDLCVIGAATTHTALMESELLNQIIPNFSQYMKLISSRLIRNMATLAGNMVNGSPIGDLSVIFQALGAWLVVKDLAGKKREIKLKDFFLGYKKVNLQPGDIVEEVCFVVPDKNSYFNFEKVGKRLHLDMATVNSATLIKTDGKKILSANFSVGGLGATIKSLEETTKFLQGKEISNQLFKDANQIAQTEITPRSRPEYKRLLVKQHLFLHLQKVNGGNLTVEALA